MPQATLPTGTNTLAEVQKNGNKQQEYFQKRLLRMIAMEQSNFVFSNLGEEISIPVNQGTTTYSIRRYNHLPVGNHKLTEGIAPTALKVEAHKVQGTVDQFGAWINVTDVEDAVNFEDIRNIYQPELARHASEVIERNIMSKFTDASEYYVNARSGVDAITADDVLSLKDLRMTSLSMKNYNRKGHRKTGGKPLHVVHTNVMQDLLDDADLLEKVLVPGNDNSPIKNGTLQSYMVYGFYIQETLIAEVKANASGVNVYTSYTLGEDPYKVLKLQNIKWIKRDFTADSNDPLAQTASVGYKLWSGAKIVDPMTITKIYSASKYDIVPDFSTDTIGAPASQD